MAKQTAFTREATGLVREFSALDSFGFQFGGIVTVVGISTLFISFSFLLGANIVYSLLILLPILLLYYIVETQLSIVMPRSGGDYVFTSRILHPAIGLVSGWVQTFLLMLNPAIFSGLIVTSYLPGLLIATGQVGLAGALSNLSVQFVLDNLIIALCFVLVIIPTRHYARAQRVLLALSVIGAILVPLALVAIGHNGFISNFNAQSPTSYDAVISEAKSLGFTPHFSWTDTVLAIPGLGFFLITNWPVQVGGELKNPRKSITLGLFGGFLLSWVIFFVTALIYYQVLGSDFASSIAFLAANSPSNAPFGGNIVLTSILQYVYGLNPVTFIVAVSLIAACILVIMQSIFLSTRFIFAWAFDRVIPAKFASINEKTATPVFTTLVLWVVAELVLLVELFASSAVGVYLNAALGVVAFPIITCLAAMVFPWKRKELFNSAPSITRHTIANVPSITIAGALAFIGFLFITVATIAFPQVGYPITPANVGFMGLMFVVGIVIYYVAKHFRGTDLDLTFKEIPPE